MSEHYTQGRRYSHIHKAWILESSWNDAEEIASLRAELAEVQRKYETAVDMCNVEHDAANKLESELAAANEQLAGATDYARRLAVTMHRDHYAHKSPVFEPFDDLSGLLSQIDNMLTGWAPFYAAPVAAVPDGLRVKIMDAVREYGACCDNENAASASFDRVQTRYWRDQRSDALDEIESLLSAQSAPKPAAVADGARVCRIDGIGGVTFVQEDPAKMPTIVSMVPCNTCKGLHKVGEACPLTEPQAQSAPKPGCVKPIRYCPQTFYECDCPSPTCKLLEEGRAAQEGKP